MKRLQTGSLALLMVTVSFLLSLMACGKKNNGGEATARLSFSNGSSLNAFNAIQSSPETFKMKLIAAYISEDVDPGTFNNTGQTGMFYLNPECENDIMHCDLSAGPAEDGNPMAHIISSYFDFGLPSAQVNAALNAQNTSIEAGTYRYARLEFCKYNAGDAKNIIWSDADTGEQEIQVDQCGVTSSIFTPPLEVEEGDSVIITLSYDLETAVSKGADATGNDCVGAGADRTCFTLPTFQPNASK